MAPPAGDAGDADESSRRIAPPPRAAPPRASPPPVPSLDYSASTVSDPSPLYALPTTSSPFVAPPAPTDIFTLPHAPSTSSRSSKRKRSCADTASSSPTKRSKASSTGFSEGAKSRLDELYGEGCWHCPAADTHTAHVFAKADAQFASAKDVGLVALEGVNDMDNALRLCRNCHGAYDAPDPRLIIVPYDLDFFFDAERRWQKACAETPCARPPVSGARYAQHCFLGFPESARTDAGLFTCYMVKNYIDRTSPPTTWMRRWHGDPGAMLWHARSIHRIARVPRHMQHLKQRLLALEALYDKGNLLLEDVHGNPLDPSHFAGAGSSGAQDRPHSSQPPPNFQGRPHLETHPSSTHYMDPNFNHAGYNASQSPDLSSPPKLPMEPLHPVSRKRARPEIEESQIETNTRANVSRKRRKLATFALTPPGPKQAQPGQQQLWRWGGPSSTTNATVEHWKRLLLLDPQVYDAREP